MTIYSIYKATNLINGKSYIGFTKNFLARKRTHIRRSTKTSIINRFYTAIRKYGPESFHWEVICQSKDGNYLLNVMESYFIEYYNTFENGYNMTKGGDGTDNNYWSIENRQKQSIRKIGIKPTKDTIEKRKLSRSWYRPTEATILLRSAEWRIISPNKDINIIKNLQKFARENNISAQRMRDVAKGRCLHYKGWICEKLERLTGSSSIT